MTTAAVRERRRERLLEKTFEVARAIRPGTAVTDYDSTIVYSLSAGGEVWQTMTFRKTEENYTHGCGWNLKRSGVMPDVFRETYEGQNFKVVAHDKPKRINYERSSRVVRKDGTIGRERKFTKTELEEQEKVVRLRLEGLTFKKIDERLGHVEDDGHWSSKIFKRS